MSPYKQALIFFLPTEGVKETVLLLRFQLDLTANNNWRGCFYKSVCARKSENKKAIIARRLFNPPKGRYRKEKKGLAFD